MCELTDRLNRTSIWLAIFAIALAVWGLTDIRHRAKTDPKNLGAHRSDFTVYTTAGAAMFDGRDPYAVTNPRGWHYLYPPLFAILVSPLAALDSQWQGVIWYAISLLAAWGCFTECRRIWRWLSATDNSTASPVVSPTIFWLAGAAVLLPALNCLQRGQVGILLTYLLLLGFRWVLTSRTAWGAIFGGLVLALPVVIKIIPALPVAFLCLLLLLLAGLHRWPATLTVRAIGLSFGVFVGLLLYLLIVPSAVIGPAANIRHLNTWVTNVLWNDKGKADDDFSFRTQRNQSFTNAAYHFGNWTVHIFGDGPDDRMNDAPTAPGGPPPPTTMPMDNLWVKLTLNALQLGLLALLFTAGWSAAQTKNPWELATVFALACLLISSISPVFRGHYYVFWLPAAWLVPVYNWRSGHQRMALSLVIAACALTWTHYLFLHWAGRIGVLGIGAMVWYFVATVSVLRAKLPAGQQALPNTPRLLNAA